MGTCIAIIPGNVGEGLEHINWYGWAYKKLNQLSGVECILRDMPDPYLCHERIWIPFMRDELKCDETTIIIGHSSGAAAAMRFAEKYKVKGIILVSAYTSDLGEQSEAESGYFNRPWEWAKMKENAGFIVQFGSEDDPFLPWKEQSEVAKGCGADLKHYTDKGHFMDSAFPELVNTVKAYLKL